jgi:hypothetical protein
MKKLCSFVLAALLIGGGLTQLTQASANNKKWHTNQISISIWKICRRLTLRLPLFLAELSAMIPVLTVLFR